MQRRLVNPQLRQRAIEKTVRPFTRRMCPRHMGRQRGLMERFALLPCHAPSRRW